MDFLRPQYLKDLTGKSAGASGGQLLTAITTLCNVMLAGRVPAAICPVLYGASLCALTKTTGDVRPIAIGNTLRRLTAKLGSMHISSRLSQLLQPVQLGFGSQSGIEAATHATRRFIEHPHSKPKVILKIDYHNAFNSLHRGAMLQSAHSALPELFPFIEQCYRNPSDLVFGEQLISSERGIQQGDPLGPALYCLTTHPLTSSLKSALNIWYLDDGTLADDPTPVLQDFRTITDKSSELGLELNPLKCELYCTSEDPAFRSEILRQFQQIAPEIQLRTLDSINQLGSPLSTAATMSCLQNKTETLQLLTSRLKDLPTHCAFFLLKNAMAIPKLTYILRCSPAWEQTACLEIMDSTLRDALSSILNLDLSDSARQQSSWPVSMGGLGIRLISDVALPAFLSSTYKSLPLVERILPRCVFERPDRCFSEGLLKWSSLTELPPPASDLRHRQKEWDLPIVQNSIRTTWEQATNPLTKARLLGVSAPESGAFLQTLPAASLGTLMSDNEFRIAMAIRLGTPFCQPHVCRCGSPVSSQDTHGLSCRRSAGRIPRHSSVNSLLQRAFASAGFPTSLEPSHLSTDNNQRPDGVTLIPWSEGRALTWDFTCGDGLAPSHVPFSSESALYVASQAELNKHAKYEYLTATHHFVPIAAECLGGFGKASLDFLRSLGKKISIATGEGRAPEFLIQRLSIAIQRGNAQAILGTLPTCETLDLQHH